MRSFYWYVVVKKQLSQKAMASIYRLIYFPTLAYCLLCLWVIAERSGFRIQAANTGFLRRVAGRTLMERVRRSTVTREELSVELLLLRGVS